MNCLLPDQQLCLAIGQTVTRAVRPSDVRQDATMDIAWLSGSEVLFSLFLTKESQYRLDVAESTIRTRDIASCYVKLSAY